MEPTKANRRGRRPKARSEYLTEALARWREKPKRTANAIAGEVAARHPEVVGLHDWLRRQLAAEDHQACLEEARRLRRENPSWTNDRIIQTVKAMHHPRRQKLHGIEGEMAAALARERPPEPPRRLEASQPPAGAVGLDWRTLGPMIAEGERAAEVAARVQADLAKVRIPSREELAVLKAQLAMAQGVAVLYEETRRRLSAAWR